MVNRYSDVHVVMYNFIFIFVTNCVDFIFFYNLSKGLIGNPIL